MANSSHLKQLTTGVTTGLVSQLMPIFKSEKPCISFSFVFSYKMDINDDLITFFEWAVLMGVPPNVVPSFQVMQT